MPNALRVDDCLSQQRTLRPLVLLVMADDEVRARFAYELTAYGFDVAVTGIGDTVRPAPGFHPDIIVAALRVLTRTGGVPAWSLSPESRLPVVAVVSDVSDATRDRARREGCVAVCLTTCSGAALATGIRAVLDHPAPTLS